MYNLDANPTRSFPRVEHDHSIWKMAGCLESIILHFLRHVLQNYLYLLSISFTLPFVHWPFMPYKKACFILSLIAFWID